MHRIGALSFANRTIRRSVRLSGTKGSHPEKKTGAGFTAIPNENNMG
jgi:hypothetical protein